MKRLIPRRKSSRKKRREEALKARVTWGFSPVSRVKESARRYKRYKKGRPEDHPDGAL